MEMNMPIKIEELGLNAPTRPKKAEKPLDPLCLKIHAFLLRKLGYIRRPQVVPLNFIAVSNRCTIKEVRYRIKQLKDRGYIEKWTTKHPTHYKQTYYRIPYLTYTKIGYSYKQGKIIQKQAIHAQSNCVSAYSKELKKKMKNDEKIINQGIYI